MVWRTLTLGLTNLLLSLSHFLIRIPGLEITPAAIVIIAQGSENVLLGATILTLAYMIPQPNRFAYIWLHLPSAVLAGYLALYFENLYVPILVYEGLSAGAGVLLGVMNGTYIMFLIVNTLLNIIIVRMYGLL